MEAKKLHVKKGDTVVVISGKDKGKKAKVLVGLPKDGKVIVEGVNMSTKHKKPSQKVQQGGIIHQESPIFASKVMLWCDKCKKGVRAGKRILQDGTKVRYCKSCGDMLDK
ncbi:50S ribosomal protein L24 [Lutispora sp.]|jgi:large subunit ribosomal protein L24|uniref:50S ribosomal protein L24 n=1 Tax=Lutispora sp. TaxID=2828727 RepID=UPI000EC99397|nr:50S ribosomal protein L24 [Lutispora sp.]MEA4963241.1 50S ribosomal protein L24 [Lutispora sp.]HCJ56165.1 50S ribosomal protein L24 [Clostridiaceae bacterium]